MKTVIGMFALVLTTAAAYAAEDANIGCVQEELILLDYDPGSPNGQMGRKTRNAASAAVADFYVSAEMPALSATTADEWCTTLTGIKNWFVGVEFHTDLANDPLFRRIRAGVGASREFLKSTIDADIYVFRDQETLIKEYAKTVNISIVEASRHWTGSWAIGVQGALFISATRLTESQNRGAPKWEPFKIASHEFAHVHHNALMGHSFQAPETVVPNDGPYWLAEGLAEYVAYLTLAERGHDVWQRLRKEAARSARKLESLKVLGPWKGMTATERAYDISHLAVELLVEETNLEQITTGYWAARAKGGAWTVTFEEVFGVTVDDFSAAFKEDIAS